MMKKHFFPIFVVMIIVIFLGSCTSDLTESGSAFPSSSNSPFSQGIAGTAEPEALPDVPEGTRIALNTDIIQTAIPLANNTQVIPPLSSSTSGSLDVKTAMLDMVVLDLMTRYNISKGVISLVSVEKKDWDSAALGCPLPGVSYAEMITPGYLIKLQAINETYTYHTDTAGTILLCGEDGIPILPEIPIPKDDHILDATPWMPVD